MEEIINFKGSLCQHRFMICQEGFCSDCMIHLDAQKSKQEKLVAVWAIKPKKPMFALACLT